MAEHFFAIGFRGIAAAWVARRVALMEKGGVWAADRDIVTGMGLPSSRDLLYPDRPAAQGERSDAEILDDIRHLAPHLVRPVRLVTLGALRKKFFGLWLTRDVEKYGKTVNLTEHQAGRPLCEIARRAALRVQMERVHFVDAPRLTVALARDFTAREGTLAREGSISASYTLTDDQQDRGETFRPRVQTVLKRTYREDFAYSLPCPDNVSVLVLPLDQDTLLLEREVGDLSVEEAFGQLEHTFEMHFDLELKQEHVIWANVIDDPADFSCIQHLRQDDSVLARLGDIFAQHGVGDAHEKAGLADGRIEENYGVFANQIAANYSHIDAAYIRALVARHGPLTPDVLGPTHRESDLGEDFGGGLRAREAKWMLEQEFARTAEDIAWRRGRFALHGADVDRLQRWMDRGAPLG
ncbi:hypothetical protein [Minwuia thermotolerans]|uniref:Uncharacterized protein n=1 Tax=Minwuia thermotolerans TaxID=2056226 RepID=A0A2M9G6M4_9PROT|nr:hypothetical protein [Minwuia thermotolerans]PJK31353.1 hypothetical protein CVT23_01345 [Minwuia thermotolerans]